MLRAAAMISFVQLPSLHTYVLTHVPRPPTRDQSQDVLIGRHAPLRQFRVQVATIEAQPDELAAVA